MRQIGCMLMLSIATFCPAAYSQLAPLATEDARVTAHQETAADVANIRNRTEATLKNMTLQERYYLLQQIRQEKQKPDTAGISRFSFDGGPVQSYFVDAIKRSTETDGTSESFGAVFDVLASFGDAGSGSVPGAQSGIQPQGYGFVSWESQHYRYENTTDAGQVNFKRKFDYSFGGMLGLYPVLVLQNLTSGTETIAQPKARPMFQDAFRWSIGPNINRPLASHAEATAFLDVGQNFLLNEVSSFKEGDNTVTATPVSNSVGRAAFFAEGGFGAKITANPIWLAHDDKVSLLSPLFSANVGVRTDNRFAASGDLIGYDHPQDRIFFRFLINLTKIASVTNDTKVAAPASLKFGVEIEKPIIEDRIPTATRYFISGNFDIMKVFRPSAGN